MQRTTALCRAVKFSGRPLFPFSGQPLHFAPVDNNGYLLQRTTAIWFSARLEENPRRTLSRLLFSSSRDGQARTRRAHGGEPVLGVAACNGHRTPFRVFFPPRPPPLPPPHTRAGALGRNHARTDGRTRARMRARLLQPQRAARGGDGGPVRLNGLIK